MATLAHCAYCFESLSASLEKRKPLNLPLTEELWSSYHLRGGAGEVTGPMKDEPPTTLTSKLPSINRLISVDSSSQSSSVPSASSSTPSLNTTASSATSKTSTTSSLFSLGGRLSRHKRRSISHEEHPLFITWDTTSRGGHKNLRGCIGTFEPQELDDGLRNYALTSAFEDVRFMPISSRELPSLECSVTLLTDFEPISDPMDWEVGKHGLRISFTSGGRRYGSTYLPSVAPEQGWTKEETIVSLMRKAGWSGHRADWRKVADLQVIRYQGQKTSLGYEAWRDWRNWVEETGQDGSP